MKFSKLTFLPLILFCGIVSFTACSDDAAISSGAEVTVTNTFQATAQTSDVETTIEDVFQMPAGSLAATAIVADAVEFPAYLLGLYDIDIDENSITFELVASVDDPTYKDFFRTLEANTIDRYYLTFDEAHNVSSSSSNDASVNLRVDSDTVLVVEIGEGFDFNPGTTFTITLN